MCYFYPDAAKDSDKLQTILCNKDSMMSQMKGKNSMVYCVENDRIYCFSKDDHIIVDCETAFKEDLPNDSLYVMHPMTDLWGKNTRDQPLRMIVCLRFAGHGYDLASLVICNFASLVLCR